MADRPLQRTSFTAIVRQAGFGAALILATAACGSPDPDPDPPPTPAAEALSDTSTPATPAAEDATDVDLAAFQAIDAAGWQGVVADPEVAAGRQVVVFAVVEQFYSAAGPGAFQAMVTATQPADAAEGTGSFLRADPALVEDVHAGDVIRVHAEVAGTFAGVTVASSVTPALTIFAVEQVGYRDLRADVVLGTPVWSAGGAVTVTVSVTNSADATMDYLVDLVAQSPDGTQQLGTVTSRVTALAPGKSGTVDARFHEELPVDALISIVDVSRARG